jgi:hypothetical protein
MPITSDRSAEIRIGDLNCPKADGMVSDHWNLF